MGSGVQYVVMELVQMKLKHFVNLLDLAPLNQSSMILPLEKVQIFLL